MMSGVLIPLRSRSLLGEAPIVAHASFGGPAAHAMDVRLSDMRKLVSGAVAELSRERNTNPKDADLGVQLRLKLASFKRIISTVAMHLDRGWRESLLARLEQLLDPEDWDESFQLPSEQSFSTFLRMIIYLHPTKRPGIGLSPAGHMLAAWTRDKDRIVIECIGNDEVRWVLSRTVDGERESGAGKVLLHRVPEVTAPYEPEHLFINGDKLLA